MCHRFIFRLSFGVKHVISHCCYKWFSGCEKYCWYYFSVPAVHLKYADPYTGGMEPSSPVTGCYLISPEEGTKFYKFFALTWSTRALIPYESTIFVNMTSRQLPCQHVAVTLGVGMAEENVGLEYTLKTCVHEWEDLGSDECAHHFRCTCQKVSCAVYVNVADFQANNGDWLLCDLATSWPV